MVTISHASHHRQKVCQCLCAILAFMSRTGLGLIAFTPWPTFNTAWLTKTEAAEGLMEHVTAFDSPTSTTPSDGDITKGGGTSHRNGAATCHLTALREELALVVGVGYAPRLCIESRRTEHDTKQVTPLNMDVDWRKTSERELWFRYLVLPTLWHAGQVVGRGRNGT